MVIENHPRLDDGSPFPTLYWLTCPIMVKRASKLESEGWMQELNDRLSADEGLRSRLADAIHNYKTARDAHEELVPSPAPPGGGPERVKCLHAHTAHELASSNPVGSLVLSLAGYPDCTTPCVTLR